MIGSSKVNLKSSIEKSEKYNVEIMDLLLGIRRVSSGDNPVLSTTYSSLH